MHPSSLIGSVFFASAAVLAVWPIRRPWSFGVLSWALSAVPNELPLQFAVIVAVANIGALDMRSTGDAVSILLAVATLSALAVAAMRALPTRRVLVPARQRADVRVSVAHQSRPTTARPWARRAGCAALPRRVVDR